MQFKRCKIMIFFMNIYACIINFVGKQSNDKKKKKKEANQGRKTY